MKEGLSKCNLEIKHFCLWDWGGKHESIYLDFYREPCKEEGLARFSERFMILQNHPEFHVSSAPLPVSCALLAV